MRSCVSDSQERSYTCFKRPDLPFDTVIQHQDNCPCHTAREIMIEIDFLGFELLPHSPYSPDLAPMDFRLFLELKVQFQGIRFHTSEELKLVIQKFVSTFYEQWFVQTYRNGFFSGIKMRDYTQVVIIQKKCEVLKLRAHSLPREYLHAFCFL